MVKMARPYKTSMTGDALAATARLFSAGVVRELATGGRSPLFTRLVREAGLDRYLMPSDEVRSLFDHALSLLQKQHRHEYVYKAALVHKVLLGVHSLRTSSLLSEFRVGHCKADVVILNGTSTVYEIKSERDNLDRIVAQVDAYLRAFARVSVIAGDQHVSRVLDRVSSEVGVLRLSDRMQISTVREATEDAARVDPSLIFDSLQLHESRLVLQRLGIAIPEVPNTMAYKAQRDLFVREDPVRIHGAMVSVLKETRSQMSLAELIDSVPHSLVAAVLTTPLRKRDWPRLCGALRVPLRDALRWA